MNKKVFFCGLGLLAMAGCGGYRPVNAGSATVAADQNEVLGMNQQRCQVIAAEVAATFPAEWQEAVRRGVQQVGKLWTAADGDEAVFKQFCQDNFVADKQQRLALLQRFDRYVEILYGYEIAVTRELRELVDLSGPEPLAVDNIFFGYNPMTNVQEELFKNKSAFIALLNFPRYSLTDLLEKGPQFSRQQWAEARLTKRFGQRIPGSAKTVVNEALAKAENYIFSYNINLSQVVDEKGQKPFPAGKKLIAHWGLRDELKAQYADRENGLHKQQLITRIMEQIIAQDIPDNFINSDDLSYEVYSGRLTDARGVEVAATSSDDGRYQKFLDIFHAQQQVDKFSPKNPSHIARVFNLDREMPVEQVEALLRAVLEAPEGQAVAQLIKKRLGRDLQPFDIWYDGFKVRSTINERALDAQVLASYKDNVAFQKEIPNTLEKLQFAPELAAFLGTKINVDAARGAGHAMQAGMRSDNAHLRTRVPAGGLDYKGFNIAMHELGHNVEQVLSLNKMDWVLLAGIPNTAFTEAFAFLFQGRDLDVLGVEVPAEMAAQAQALKTLDNFWSVREIAGVALLDIQVWQYMYAHPDLDRQQLKAAIISLAKDLWQQYYAPVLGTGESTLLAVYSHMICFALYLPDYPMGHLIHYQIESAMQGQALGVEFARMATTGAVTPAAWMQTAVGRPVSAQPLLEATRQALESGL